MNTEQVIEFITIHWNVIRYIILGVIYLIGIGITYAICEYNYFSESSSLLLSLIWPLTYTIVLIVICIALPFMIIVGAKYGTEELIFKVEQLCEKGKD